MHLLLQSAILKIDYRDSKHIYNFLEKDSDSPIKPRQFSFTIRRKKFSSKNDQAYWLFLRNDADIMLLSFLAFL